MLRFSKDLSNGSVCVSCSQNEDEKEQLIVLARQLKMIGKMNILTGLLLGAEMEIDENVVVITSIRKSVLISAKELKIIRKEVISRLRL